MNIKKTGEQIAALRKAKGLTQSELGERIGVSFQAVSKWERGETLPDITVLPDLAKILETTAISGKIPDSIMAISHTVSNPSLTGAKFCIRTYPVIYVKIPTANPSVIIITMHLPIILKIFLHNSGLKINPMQVIRDAIITGKRFIINGTGLYPIHRPEAIHPTGMVDIP
ncbi:MAG: helix-turn-helix transcriptional regulator, partial [Clostridia bacterium]|nr:helix-turn-helix transcriptional regulator [Clostridia bacterium]